MTSKQSRRGAERPGTTIALNGKHYALEYLHLSRGAHTHPRVLAGEKEFPIISLEHIHGQPVEKELRRAERAVASFEASGEKYSAIPDGEVFRGDTPMNVDKVVQDVLAGRCSCDLWEYFGIYHIHVSRKTYDADYYSFNIWDKEICARVLEAKPRRHEIEERALQNVFS
ncbi:MAG: hypothetical protein CL840_15895 [Crocinitomicaceae bacterium]|nr:hypothetical protein [Crocinitomicaceae bacterium]|tara:strand:- start:21376 stop:21885 length:510 start_codon:yes stop_codon:yes gene_type:complete